MPLMVAEMARLSSVGVAFACGALAADEFDLEEAHRVDVGVAQADGALEDGVGLEEASAVAVIVEDHAAG